jgi:hypothetical protein
VFHLAGAEIMQKGTPPLVFLQIFGHMFGDENVTAIGTIHHPLCNVETGSGQIRTIININHTAHRSAMNAHPQA